MATGVSGRWPGGPPALSPEISGNTGDSPRCVRPGRVWPLLNEAVANRYLRDLEERFTWGRGPKDDGGGGRAVPRPCPGPRNPQAAHPVSLVA